MQENKIDTLLNAGYTGIEDDNWSHAQGRSRKRGLLKSLKSGVAGAMLGNPVAVARLIKGANKKQLVGAMLGNPVAAAKLFKGAIRNPAPANPIQSPASNQPLPVQARIPIEPQEQTTPYVEIEEPEATDAENTDMQQDEESEYLGYNGGESWDNATGKKKFNIKGILGKAAGLATGLGAIRGGVAKSKDVTTNEKEAAEKAAADKTGRFGGVSKPIVFTLLAVVLVVVIVVVYTKSRK